MQWSGDMNAGFNNKTNSTWLPVHPDYKGVNVEVHSSFGDGDYDVFTCQLAALCHLGAEEG